MIISEVLTLQLNETNTTRLSKCPMNFAEGQGVGIYLYFWLTLFLPDYIYGMGIYRFRQTF